MIIINVFHQVLNVSVCSAHHKIFAFTYTFDIMQFDNMLQTFFNASFRGSRHYQPELSNLPAIGYLPA